MQHKNEFALLLLESPWWLPKDNPMRASSLPFFQGLERLYDDFNIYYSTFYDASGFETALVQDLLHTQERRQILYIGAHGNKCQIAQGRASNILRKVAQKGHRIGGVILSSCMVAERASNYLDLLKSGGVSWFFGYTKSVDWLASMLLEVAILEALAGTTSEVDQDQEEIVKIFASALCKFNPYAPFGEDNEQLKDCLCLSQRAKHKRGAKNLTEQVMSLAWNDCDLNFCEREYDE